MEESCSSSAATEGAVGEAAGEAAGDLNEAAGDLNEEALLARNRQRDCEPPAAAAAGELAVGVAAGSESASGLENACWGAVGAPGCWWSARRVSSAVWPSTEGLFCSSFSSDATSCSRAFREELGGMGDTSASLELKHNAAQAALLAMSRAPAFQFTSLADCSCVDWCEVALDFV